MSYSIWGPSKAKDNRRFHEKAFRRGGQAAWDARWHSLSVEARAAFLDDVKGPARSRSMDRGSAVQPSVPIAKFAPRVLDELTTAGFVVVRGSRMITPADRVFAVEDTVDFASRVRSLHRYHLLVPEPESMVGTYLNACFSSNLLYPALFKVLRDSGIDDLVDFDALLKHYVLGHRWPDMVVKSLKDPVAARIMAAVRQADRPTLLADLPGRIEGTGPEKVRSSLENLIAHVALVEDLDPKSLDLQVGLLPAVRDSIARASLPRVRPPLLACDAPKELGPDEGILVGDLRALLLEVASEPPRLRQDRQLFQKEIERFEDILEPLPAWLTNYLGFSPEGRLNHASEWARYLKMVKEVVAGKLIHLHLAPKGQKWLTSGIDFQHADLLDPFRAPTSQADLYKFPQAETERDFDPYDYYSGFDLRFHGVNVVALKGEKGRRPPSLYNIRPKDLEPLRDALDRACSALPIGAFHRLDSFLDHSVFADHNPVNLGVAPGKGHVSLYSNGRLVPPVDERREEVGRQLLDSFIRLRLIPLGCLRTAIDDQGRLCIAREPLLDAYFGRATAPGKQASASKATADEASKVIVQPDFSVVIIGPNPAPAADLIPFCERTTRGPGRGAIVLKVTRESVIKAVAHGLSPSEVVTRLKRHVSHEIPANVLREVEGWAGWVRHVKSESLTVLRCPDRESADRVMAALRKQAERLQDTLVAIEPARLTAVERKKLQDQGILIESVVKAREPKAKTKKARRLSY